jgi:hypothetical protein
LTGTAKWSFGGSETVFNNIRRELAIWPKIPLRGQSGHPLTFAKLELAAHTSEHFGRDEMLAYA